MNARPVLVTKDPSTAPLPPWRHERVAVALHWGLALLLTAAAALGWTMMALEDEPGADVYFMLHKSLGLLIASAVAVRILWRASHRPQPLPAAVPRWQARLSAAIQGLLYLAMAAVPLSGYLGASYSKAGVAFFGLPTPAWAVPDHDRAEQLFGVHEVLVWLLVALVAAHLLGALKHLLIDKDGVFQRMRW
jgi:cytochrome b561